MMKVLIVDDEPIFRMGIRSCVSWEELGCEVCGEAENGKEALSMIEEQAPDVVFLDIKMPVMDGIEVMRRLVGKEIRSYIVVLSCFNEYEYVREAMKLGAYDYLFKPVMGLEEIANVMKEIQQKEVVTRHARGNEKQIVLQKIGEILKASAESGVSGEDRESLLALDCDYVESGFTAVGLCMEREGERICPDETAHRFCQEAFSDAFGEMGIGCFFWEKTEIFYVIIKASGRVSFSRQPLWQELLAIARQIERDTGDSVRIGVSRLGGRIDRYADHIAQVGQALAVSWFTGETVSFAPPERKSGVIRYEDRAEGMQELLEKRDMQRIREFLCSLREEAIRNEAYNENDYCHFLALHIVSFMRHIWGGKVLEQLLLQNVGLISAIYHQFSADAANEKFCRILETCYHAVEESETGKSQELIVRHAMEYIRTHYAQKNSLGELAEQYHLNKNYFCKIFKEFSGKNLVYFITEVRMEKATEMLQNSDKKIGAIAVEVGFPNYSHFCKTYREYYGVSPSEVRRNFASR